MSSKFDTLSEADIERIRQLVEVLEKSSFDFLTLELGDLKLTLGTGAAGIGAADLIPSSPPTPAAPPAPTSAPAPEPVSPAAAPAAPSDGLVDVTAPTMGHFYARPDPGSEPFVSVGSCVTAHATVGLLEVMKLFNSVTAGVDGIIEEICVTDSELVEYGQVLMRIRPPE